VQWDSFWNAIGLMIVLEGIMPFLNPAMFRSAMLRMAEMDDRALRLMGFFSMMLGALLFHLM
jgi:uncharacterized protein YjeT (DUF2065 family)